MFAVKIGNMIRIHYVQKLTENRKIKSEYTAA